MSVPKLRDTISAAPGSAALIAANLAVLAAVSLDARLLDVLALPATWAGIADRPWTVLTVLVTGGALLHVVLAVVVVALVGVRLERRIGASRLLVTYLLAGATGSLAFVATATATGYAEPAVGASAAFLGLLGALATSPRGAWERLPADKLVAVVVVIQLVAPLAGIGVWASSVAHLAGLAVGAAYGHLLRTESPGGRRDPALARR